ncbi:MAG: CocE/NonD family hydrolase [Pseudomonadota bacterium]
MSDTSVKGNVALGANASDCYDKLPSSLEDRAAVGSILSDQMVAMRDGVRLATDVYLPAGDGPFPTVLTRLPYGKTESWTYLPVIADHWMRMGFAAVVQDVRGKWNSEGEFNPNLGEAEDGYDTLEWIANQAWSNGAIGMWGESYYGFTSYAAASTRHPALVCIAPTNISVDRYAATLRQGCLQLNTVGTWAIMMADQTYQDLEEIDYWHLPLAELPQHNGVVSEYFNAIMRNPRRSDFWESRSVLSAYENITIPVLHIGGWYDNYLGPTIVDWRRMAKTNAETKNQYLFIGPWDHDGSADLTGRVGSLPVNRSVATIRWDTITAFFDRHLQGVDNGFGRDWNVKYFSMGEDAWRESASWPPPEVRMTPIYLHSNGAANTLHGDGSLSFEKPVDHEPADHFDYDPNNPVADTLEIDCWNIAEEMQDRKEVEKRQDVLVYTSEPFPDGLNLSGPVSACMYFASSAVDTDVTVTLVDLAPDGTTNLIQDGILRVRFRNGIDSPELMTPGDVYALEIDIWSTSYTLGVNHCLRVETSSSCFNRYDRNLNTGEPLGVGDHPIVATQTVFHDATRPSHVLLPVRRD